MLHVLRVLGMAAIVWFPLLVGPCSATELSSRPFRPGERLTFDLKWGAIGAGSAVLQVLPVTTLNKEEAYHFEVKVRSSKTIDRIYKIRDLLESFADINMTHSLLYKQKIREGGYRKERVITFDWEKNELAYVSDKRAPRYIPIIPGTFDPLSAFYFLRLQPYQVSSSIECPITDGKINVIGRANILRREKIEVRNRIYDTYVLEPVLDDVELFSSDTGSNIRIWITADKRRMPVLIESRVTFGIFRAELRRVEHVSVPAKQ